MTDDKTEFDQAELECSCGCKEFTIEEESRKDKALLKNVLSQFQLLIACDNCGSNFIWNTYVIVAAKETADSFEEYQHHAHKKQCPLCKNGNFHISTSSTYISQKGDIFPRRYEFQQKLECTTPDCTWFNEQTSISEMRPANK